MMEFYNFAQHFQSNFKQSWKPAAKIGVVLIGIGLLILILKDLIIISLAAVFVGLGIYLLFIALKAWYSTRLV